MIRQLPGLEPTVVHGLDSLHSIGRFGWKPQLRAARSRPQRDLPDFPYLGYLELHCDGLVEFGWLSVIEGASRCILHSDHAVQGLANVICWADTLRRYANVGRAEYAVQAGVHVTGEKVLVVQGPRTGWGADVMIQGLFGELSRGVTAMPRYALDEVSDAAALLSTFEHDLCNAAGMAFANDTLGRFEIEYEQG